MALEKHQHKQGEGLRCRGNDLTTCLFFPAASLCSVPLVAPCLPPLREALPLGSLACDSFRFRGLKSSPAHVHTLTRILTRLKPQRTAQAVGAKKPERFNLGHSCCDCLRWLVAHCAVPEIREDREELPEEEQGHPRHRPR